MPELTGIYGKNLPQIYIKKNSKIRNKFILLCDKFYYVANRKVSKSLKRKFKCVSLLNTQYKPRKCAASM